MFYRINLSCIWSPTSIPTLTRLLIGASGSVIILGKKWERSCLGLYVGDEGDLSRIHDERVPVEKHSCAYPSKLPNAHLSFLSNLTLFSTVWAYVNTTTYQQASIRLCFLGAERTIFSTAWFSVSLTRSFIHPQKTQGFKFLLKEREHREDFRNYWRKEVD